MVVSDHSDELVSVVMAVHAEDDVGHLKEAITSIKAQRHSNIELVVVVDGPVDEHHRQVIESETRGFNSRVIWIERNEGPAAARNVAIAEVKGIYVAIMDSDDISRPDRIGEQLRYLKKHRLDVVSSSLNVVDNNGETVGERCLPCSEEGVRRRAPFRCPLHNPAAFGRTDVFRYFPYNEAFRVSEDYELWVRMLLSGIRLGNVPTKSVLYRQSVDSVFKRRGWIYAKSDFFVKWKARRLVEWYSQPIVVVVALVSSIVRLFPVRMFRVIYQLKDIDADNKV